MNKILFINSCVRPNSRTLDLANHVLGNMCGEIQRVDLYDMPLKPLDNELIEKRMNAARLQDFSDDMFTPAKQFAEADTVVIAAPYWDLLFPAVLRTYLETVCVAGITFRYAPQGFPISMCKAKKLYYITTAGGFIRDNNFGFNYIKALAENLFGIKDVRCLTAEGLDIDPDKAEEILNVAKAKGFSENED